MILQEIISMEYDRKKIRFRWYNNDETKIFYFQVWKNIKEIKLSNDKKELLNKLKDICISKEFKYTNDFNHDFILKTNYHRSYWVSDDKKFRATIDTEINASSLKNILKPIYLQIQVLEFKFLPIYETEFRNFFNSKSYKIKKSKIF